MFYADLHIHSRYSRATSQKCDLEHLAFWGRKKGLSVVGTGDFTHPSWMSELTEKLVPAEAGLFKLRSDLERAALKKLPPACAGPIRFMLQVEISTIYKKGDKTRKVHHIVYAPDFESARKIAEALDRVGNIKSDGRPILGLDSRDLLEITLEAGEGAFLVPAHIWTPWFAAMGSKSGFDSIEDCYGDLAGSIFAVETGLSSDPPMNWRLSGLDRYTLISNSDAHSPAKLAREACIFECEMDYFSMRTALSERNGYGGTVEFYPEEGKYHLDGHRKCGVCFSPVKTREADGICPVCGKKVTVGVMHRIEQLADCPEGRRPEGAAGFASLIPLSEIISETVGVGPNSKKVTREVEELSRKIGPELFILRHAPLEDVAASGGALLAEGIGRMRAGEVIRNPGFDGEYGVIRLFTDDELSRGSQVGFLFDLPEGCF